jgi:GMP reductase
MNLLFDFDDILILPEVISTISSRKEVMTRDDNNYLPIFSAPMDTVIDKTNYQLFMKNGIFPVLPRESNVSENNISTDMFLSYGLEDFERIFLSGPNKFVEPGKKIHALIDVANGHMKKLLNMSETAKKRYGSSMKLMVGNVAHPETFYEYCKVGVDMVRIGIGNGNGCLTTVQTGIGYPMASLIGRCSEIRSISNYQTKIVADGGFKKYSDIIKALALGADYVMLGSILNKALESAGETNKRRDSTLGGWEPINQYSEEAKKMFNADIELTKVFRGMSTKEVQKSWGKETLTTSEGVVRRNKVEYTLEGWVKNFEDYLKSAMSYTGKKELHQFIGGVKYNLISQNSYLRFNK